jgi:hypothetical protein
MLRHLHKTCRGYVADHQAGQPGSPVRITAAS